MDKYSGGPMSVTKKSARITAHGEERKKKHVVNSGKTEYIRREKYCVKHGWVDVLATGGDAAWSRYHDDCHFARSSGLRTRS